MEDGTFTCLSVSFPDLFQDTVVALQALSKYGAATFSRTESALEVTIQSSGTFSTKFQVNNNNRLLLQQVSLPKVPGEYSAIVKGHGCVYLQVSLGQIKMEGLGQPRSVTSPNSVHSGANARRHRGS